MSELDPEEAALLASVEKGEWASRTTLSTRKQAIQEAAKQHLSGKNHLDIALSTPDFERLKALAAQHGLNYQVMAENILHRYLKHS